MPIERAAKPLPTWSDIASDFDRHTAMNAVVAWLYAITGPLAILFAALNDAKLEHGVVASWIFGCYAIGGLLSVIMSCLYRQPIAMAWSIPAVMLAGPALGHLSLSEVIGAYVVAGAIIALIGLSGGIGKAMRYVPAPILMGMVCGVFLPFGLKIITGFQNDFLIAATVTIAFVAASMVPRIGRVLPPVLIALVIGFGVVIANGQLVPTQPVELGLVQPLWFTPSFSVRAQVELVVPLIVTVIGIHNPQGFAVLSEAKYAAPVNAMTFASGIGSVVSAFVGGGSICVAGPSNALLCSSGQPHQRYVGGIVFGSLMMAFGIAAPMAVSLSLSLPVTFISVLGGLAILRVLQGWMASAFGGALGLGALVAFLVTMSGIVVFHISAPFWGVVAGMATSLLLERSALRQSWAQEAS